MGEVIDLEAVRRRADTPLGGGLSAANVDRPVDLESIGWLAVEEGDDGEPVRWFHPRHIAQIGLVPTSPEWVFLDHQGRVRAWSSLTVEQVARALDAGELPSPDVTMTWDGSVVLPDEGE
ncbi:MAG: hypothetical protein ABMA64_28790 [Myxococcota bacterium]